LAVAEWKFLLMTDPLTRPSATLSLMERVLSYSFSLKGEGAPQGWMRGDIKKGGTLDAYRPFIFAVSGNGPQSTYNGIT